MVHCGHDPRQHPVSVEVVSTRVTMNMSKTGATNIAQAMVETRRKRGSAVYTAAGARRWWAWYRMPVYLSVATTS